MSASPSVLVTGASGFVASAIAQHLLTKGYSTRGTVRKLSNAPKLNAGASKLEFVEADLLKDGSFNDAAQGCSVVMHAASPYIIDVKDPQRDLVDPAVKGTLNVLHACAKSGTVKRVVLTSSIAAVTDEPERDRVLTEADWNTKSSLNRNPYYYSKTQAEKAAWTFMQETRPSFDLVAINPFLVLGPSLVPTGNTSTNIFIDLLKGRYPAIMNITWGFVDVRDVADAHVRAMENPKARGRYLCASETLHMRRVVEILKANAFDKNRKLPTLPLDNGIGNLLVWLFSFKESKGVGQYMRSHVGRVPRYDTTKIRTELGMTFRPAEQSLLETMNDLKKWGHL